MRSLTHTCWVAVFPCGVPQRWGGLGACGRLQRRWRASRPGAWERRLPGHSWGGTPWSSVRESTGRSSPSAASSASCSTRTSTRSAERKRGREETSQDEGWITGEEKEGEEISQTEGWTWFQRLAKKTVLWKLHNFLGIIHWWHQSHLMGIYWEKLLWDRDKVGYSELHTWLGTQGRCVSKFDQSRSEGTIKRHLLFKHRRPRKTRGIAQGQPTDATSVSLSKCDTGRNQTALSKTLVCWFQVI